MEFKGTFSHSEEVKDEYGKYWISRNEKGESYYDVRNSKTQKYVVAVHPDNKLVSCVCTDGVLSFVYPMEIYFTDTIPDMDNVHDYMYVDGEFKTFINYDAEKYNKIKQIEADMLNNFHEGIINPELSKRLKAVKAATPVEAYSL